VRGLALRALVLAVLAGVALGVAAADAGIALSRHEARARVTQQQAWHGPEVTAA
jgi:hypothetical protein